MTTATSRFQEAKQYRIRSGKNCLALRVTSAHCAGPACCARNTAPPAGVLLALAIHPRQTISLTGTFMGLGHASMLQLMGDLLALCCAGNEGGRQGFQQGVERHLGVVRDRPDSSITRGGRCCMLCSSTMVTSSGILHGRPVGRPGCCHMQLAPQPRPSMVCCKAAM